MSYYMKTYNDRYVSGMFRNLSVASVRFNGKKEQKKIERNNLIFCTTSCIQSSTQQLNDREKLASNESVVKRLLKQPFWTLQYSEKVKIIENGRPVPCFEVSIKENKSASSFVVNEDLYKSISWICGCHKFKRLYCWPCLLFSKEVGEWNAYGYTKFSDLVVAQKEHQVQYVHMYSMKELKLFGKTKYIDLIMNDEFKGVTDKYNQVVEQNRKILNQLILIISILGTAGIDCRNISNNNDMQIDSGSHLKLLNILNCNTDFYTNIKGSKNFFSTSLINDLICSISEIMLQEIKKEISETKYVTLSMHVVPSIDTKCYVASILRYINLEGNVVERFVDLSLIDSGKNRSTLFAFFISIIHQFEISNKLIAYNYDGALLRMEDHNHLQNQIQEEYQYAMFVNNYSNNTKTVGDKSCNFNAILIQSLCDIDLVRIFFSLLKQLSNFLLKTAKYLESLDPDVFQILSSVNIYNCESDFIEVLYENKGKIREALTTVVLKPLNWDLDTISNVYNIVLYISRFDFNFFLEIFYLVLPATHKLFEIMQDNILYDLLFIHGKITELRQLLHKLRQDFKPVWNMVYEKSQLTSDSVLNKTSITTIQNLVDSNNSKRGVANRHAYRNAFYDIIDSIKLNITVRFNELTNLGYLDLLNSSKFLNYRTTFPENSLLKLKNNPITFDYESLKKELTIIYNDKEIGKDLNLMKLFNYIKSLDLGDILPETLKLCSVLLTYPLVNISVYDSSTKLVALDRLNEYISNQNRALNSVLVTPNALFYIEKTFLESLRRKYRDNFDELVLKVFSNKNHKIDLTYRL